MNIQIVRKKAPVKSVTLLFKKQTLRTQYSKIPTVSIYDEESKYVSASVSLNRIQSRIPATLLARWVNINYPDKLLTLIDRCNTVEYSYDTKHSQNGKWYFRSKENTIYGLNKLKKRVDSVTTRYVVIDDSLGMQDVKNILNMLDIEIECDYDVSKQRMLKITLKGDV
mgnify:CR=1 FL=1